MVMKRPHRNTGNISLTQEEFDALRVGEVIHINHEYGDNYVVTVEKWMLEQAETRIKDNRFYILMPWR